MLGFLFGLAVLMIAYGILGDIPAVIAAAMIPLIFAGLDLLLDSRPASRPPKKFRLGREAALFRAKLAVSVGSVPKSADER